MSDLFAKLRHLDDAAAAPLPATEVRRRGDRIRRRRAALQGLGAAAALAAVLGSGVMFSGHGSGTGPGPLPHRVTHPPVPTGDWLTRIPRDFPLDQALPAATATAASRTVDDPTPTWNFRVGCAPVPLEQRLDSRASYVTGADLGEARELALYPGDRAARKQVEQLRDAASCEDQALLGSASLRRFSVTPLGAGDILLEALTYDGRRRVAGRQSAVVSQVGNAVLMVTLRDDSTAVAMTDRRGQQVLARAASLTAAMCIFAAEPCATRPTSTPEPADGVTTEIPGDLPLTADLAAPESGVQALPSSAQPGVGEVTVCGAVVYPAGTAADRLAVQTTGVQYGDSREVVSYPAVAVANLTFQALRHAVLGCEREEASGAVGRRTVLSVGLGDESFSAVTTYQDTEPGPPPGLEQLQVVRVGNALLVSVERSETVPADGALEAVVQRRASTMRAIVAAMCVFDSDGCPNG